MPQLAPLSVIIWICVGVFGLTSAVTLLALVGRVKLGRTAKAHDQYLRLLVKALVLEIVVVSVAAYGQWAARQREPSPASTVAARSPHGVGSTSPSVSVDVHRLATEKKLEKLLAIYSLLSWRNPLQQPPRVTRWHETEASIRELNLSKAPPPRAGESDFLRSLAVEGDPDSDRTIWANDDFSWEFKWSSVFGYDLTVTVFPSGHGRLHHVAKKLSFDEKAFKEDSRSRESCSFETYVVRVRGLTDNEEVAFVLSNGWIDWTPDGSWYRQNEWIIAFDEGKTLTLSDLNDVIQRALRRLSVVETDLTKAAPVVQVNVAGQTGGKSDALLDELLNDPKLSETRDVLQGLRL